MLISELQVGYYLGFMNRKQYVNCLDFKNDFVFNQDINTEFLPNIFPFVEEWNRRLSFRMNTSYQ